MVESGPEMETVAAIPAYVLTQRGAQGTVSI